MLPATDDADDGKTEDDDECGDKARSIYQKKLLLIGYILYYIYYNI